MRQPYHAANVLYAIFVKWLDNFIVLIMFLEYIKHFEPKWVNPTALHQPLTESYEHERHFKVISDNTGVKECLKDGNASEQHRGQVSHKVCRHLLLRHVCLQHDECFFAWVVAHVSWHLPWHVLANLIIYFFFVVAYRYFRKLVNMCHQFN